MLAYRTVEFALETEEEREVHVGVSEGALCGESVGRL